MLAIENKKILIYNINYTIIKLKGAFMSNSKRVLVKIIREICAESGYTFRSFSYDWILQISKSFSEKSMFIYGYQFPLNDSASDQICCDKAALSAVLNGNGIAAAEHNFFMSPSNIHYTGEDGNWQRIIDIFEQYGKKAVLKRNTGSGGGGVFAVNNRTELERAASEIFRTCRAMTVSPFYDIEDEFRLIMLAGKPKLIYKKIRPCVYGDGKSDIFTLSYNKYGSAVSEAEFSVPLYDIPEKGKLVYLNWKHNLGRGASAEEITDKILIDSLSALAVSAVNLLHINFCSVDIVMTSGKLLILEINSGVMMENFSSFNEVCYDKAKNIYREAINNYFSSAFTLQ